MPTPDTLATVMDRFPDHRQRYAFALAYAGRRKVADIACGAGYGSKMLGAVAEHVIGYDIDVSVLAHARRHFSANNVCFEHEATIARQTFELIVSFETIEHMTASAGDLFLEKLRGAISDHGILIISTPLNRTAHRTNVTPFHLREYNEAEFSDKLAATGFAVERWFGQGSRVLMMPAFRSYSLGTLLRTRLHRLVPAVIRRPLVRFLLSPRVGAARGPCDIIPDTLVGASVQIAVCRPLCSSGAPPAPHAALPVGVALDDSSDVLWQI